MIYKSAHSWYKSGAEGIRRILNDMFHEMPVIANRTGTKIGCWTSNLMVLPGRTQQADTNRIVRKAGLEMAFLSMYISADNHHL